ncbi:hypothetical protein ACWCOP_12935 [Maricaulaceae bacterium MS644]
MNRDFRNRALIIAALVAAIALLWLVMRPGEDPSVDPEQLDLLDLLRAAEAEAAWPGLDVESAAAELGSPEAAAAFLQSHVVLQDYAGRFAAPGDVLLTRGANAEDQAVLLSALVEAMGFETRLSQAPWPAGPVPRLIPAARERPAHQAVLSHLGIDAADSLERRLSEGRALADALRGEVETAHAILSETLQLAGPATSSARPDRRLVVEYRSAAGPWIALDPVLGEAARPGAPVSPEALEPVIAHLDLITAEGARRRLLDFELSSSQEARLSFLPAAGAALFLEGAPDPSRVPLWRPVIQQGERAEAGLPFTPAGRPAPEPDSAVGAVPAPVLSSAEIVDIDLTAWPEVALTVVTDALPQTIWRASHIALTENGAPVRARVEAPPQPPRDVSLVTDVSPSMVEAGRIFVAGEVGRALIARTVRPQAVAAATAAGSAATQRNRSIFFTPQHAINDFETGLTIRPGDDLTGPIGAPGDPRYGPIDVVVLTDGQVDDAQIEALNALRDGDRRRIFAVVPALEAPRFTPAVDRVFILPEDEAGAADLGRAIAAAIGSRLTLSFVAEPGPVDEPRALSLRFVAADVVAEGAYAAPAAPEGRARLALSLTRAGAPLGETRTLAELGGDEAGWRLMGEHALFVSGGRFDSAAVMRAFYGHERFVFETGLEDAAAAPPAGPDADMLAAAGQMTGLTQAGASAALAGDRLQALLISTSPTRRAGDLVIATRIDLLSDGGLGAAGGARAGLAAAAAEAALLGTRSVNASLAGQSRVTIDPRTPLPQGWPEAVLEMLRGTQRTLVASEDGREGWLVEADGHVTARLFEPAAKGASVERIAAEFSEIRTALGLSGAVSSGLLSPYGVSGAKVGALFAILDFDVRLFCASSVMMGFVNEEIEGVGDEDEDWLAYAQEECEIKLDAPVYDLVSSVAGSAVRGELGDRVTNFVKLRSAWGATHGGEVVVNTTAGLTIDYLSSLSETAEALEARRPQPLPGRVEALARAAASPE